MKKMTCAVLISVLLVTGCDLQLAPGTFDDCILKNLRGVTSNQIAAQIQVSCREKFPEKAIPQLAQRSLQPVELVAVTGRAGLSYGNRYGGTLYNGNSSLTVTQIEIQVGTKEGGKNIIRDYTTDIVIPPLTAKDFAFDVIVGDRGSDYSWALYSARGF